MKPPSGDLPSNLVVRTISDPGKPPVPETEEEREWIERARAGDAAAFRMLVERYGDRTYGLAFRMLGSPSDAEEVAQDAFVRAWRALPRFRGESSFSTWLHRIVVRRALDRSATLKSRRARETGIEDLDPLEPVATAGAPVSGDLARRLDRLLGALSDMQRAVVLLYYYEDHSVEHVAQSLSIPVGTVKTHLHRARALLRTAWIEEDRRLGQA